MANQKAEELFGYDDGGLMGVSVEELLPERFREHHAGLRSGFQKRPESRPMGEGRDLFARRRDGNEFPVEIGLMPVELPGGDRFVQAVIVDISERKKAETAVREQAQILASIHEAVFLVGPEGEIRTWNRGAEEVFGWKADEVIGSSIRKILPADNQERFSEKVYPIVCRDRVCEFTAWCHHKSGREVNLSVRASLHGSLDKPDGAIICASDITRQKQLEEEILQVSENEQRRIGQDIHDDLCQQLAGIGCLTRVLRSEVEEVSETCGENLAMIEEMVTQANVRAREISRGLIPSMIQREGLAGALEEVARQTKQVFGIDCEFHCPDPVFLDDDKTTVQLYRIAQEAVGNAVKHSDANLIEIRLDSSAGKLTLAVEDDGRGIPEGGTGTGLGLMTMARRAEMLQGDLDIHTSSGRGARISCAVPYDM